MVFFWSKWKINTNKHKYAHEMTLFEKNVSRKKLLIVGCWGEKGNRIRGVVNVSREREPLMDTNKH